MTERPEDRRFLRRCIATATSARLVASPNPWVGACVVADGVVVADGATRPPGEAHAEVVALAEAGEAARGATLYVTLEPCDHTGRTGPCTEAILDAGVARVVVGVEDPDPAVAGRGLARLATAGVEVTAGVLADEVALQLRPYLHHRRLGRPYVVLKLATTLDGRLAAADGTSGWITGPEARADVHRLRAESDAICVGAGTVRADDPLLTVRSFRPSDGTEPADPRRIVLGAVPEGARVLPADSLSGDLTEVVAGLGAEGVVQLLVEGGADVAGRLLRTDLVDLAVVYVAPAFAGGDDGVPMFRGPGAASVDRLWRGRFESVTRLGDDVRLVVVP